MKDNKQNFNDSISFNKELVNILTDLLIDKIKYIIRCSVEEYDIEPIKKLLCLLDEHKQYET